MKERSLDAQVKLRNKIHHMADQDIINEIGMARLPLIIHYFLKKYHGKYSFIDIDGDCMFRFGNFNVANVSYLATHLHFLTVKDRELVLEGNVSWPAELKEHFCFQIRVGEDIFEPDLFDAGFDQKEDDTVYEYRGGFQFKLPLIPRKDYRISFCYICDNIYSKSGKINSLRFMPAADVLECQYACLGEWIAEIRDGMLILTWKTEELFSAKEALFLQKAKEKLSEEDFEKVQRIREKYFSLKNKSTVPLWLFTDRLDKADDNAEAFFRYLCSRNEVPGDCRFVISKDAEDYDRLMKTGTVTEALSEEHCVLLAAADMIFTSQLNGWCENPYQHLEEYFRDIYHGAKVVFLQHGVTKDDQTVWLNRYNQNLYAIVTSSEKEKEAFLRYPYHYEPSQIWNVGMPRFDRLTSGEKKYILFMPTWRKSVMEQHLNPETGTYRWYLKEDFYRSKYYKLYHSILTDTGFIDQCETLGYRILFMPHPIMQPYKDAFGPSERVTILPYDSSWREIFAESCIMITDYSSVAFDFAYLFKPVIYFQFDDKEFRRSHTYSRGYFDYKTMGFGKIVKNIRSLKNVIDAYLRNECRIGKEYKDRITSFFAFHDQKNCERLYEKILLQDGRA